MGEPSIATVDAKINSFISSQDKHNDTVTKAIDKISDAMSNLQTVHTEINHLSEKITHCENSVTSINSDIKTMNDKVITNSIQADEYKHIKKLIMGFIVAGVLGGAFITKMTSDNYAKKDAILQEQAKVMAEIAVAIKDNIKGK